MQEKYNSDRAVRLLEVGIANIKEFGAQFKAYNLKYLGCSPYDHFTIKGKSTENSKFLNEFCYGYDGTYHELHLLHVYEMTNGKKYAATEITRNNNAFWEIIE